MHCTVLVWVPPPQDCEHAVKSDTFQRGGHGFSLHVRTWTRGRVNIDTGLTLASCENGTLIIHQSYDSVIVFQLSD